MKKIEFNKEQKQDIIERFNNGERLYQIAKIYNCNYTVIRDRLRKWINYKNDYNLLNKCDESYFEKINTREKAYFLGLMYSDGCVREGKKRSKQLMICLQEGDENVLEDFEKQLKYDGKLYFGDRTGKFCSFRGKTYKCSNYYKLHISSDKLCEDLINLGCLPRKTKILKFPTLQQVTNKYMPYFILGYLDGDGYVSARKDGQTAFGFSGTKSFLSGVKKYLHEILNFKITNKIDKREGSYCLSYVGNTQAAKFYKLVYKNIKIFLKRKKDKFKINLKIV